MSRRRHTQLYASCAGTLVLFAVSAYVAQQWSLLIVALPWLLWFETRTLGFRRVAARETFRNGAPARVLGGIAGEPHDLPTPPEVLEVCETFRRAGHLVVVVGGRVRDHIAGSPPAEDWDLGTSATYREIRRLRRDAITDDSSHTDLTVALLRTKTIAMEMTPFRNQHDFERGVGVDRDVPASTLGADLRGRDFTINAMAYDPIERQLYDPSGGREDLKRHLLRSLPDPESRFRFDPVRILRGVRIAGSLGLTIEEQTYNSMLTVARSEVEFPTLRSVREVNRALVSPRASWCLEELARLEVLPRIVPPLTPLVVSAPSPYTNGLRSWEVCMRALEDLEPKSFARSWAIVIGSCALEARGQGQRDPFRSIKELRRAAAQVQGEFESSWNIDTVAAEAVSPDQGRLWSEWGEELELPHWIPRVVADALAWSATPDRYVIWSDLSEELGDELADLCAELAEVWRRTGAFPAVDEEIPR